MKLDFKMLLESRNYKNRFTRYTVQFDLKVHNRFYSNKGIMENKKKFIKMMAVIVGAFGICWLPWHFFHVVGMIYPTVMRYACHNNKAFIIITGVRPKDSEH